MRAKLFPDFASRRDAARRAAGMASLCNPIGEFVLKISRMHTRAVRSDTNS